MRKLLLVIQRLADAGNTLVVIEHNLEVLKCADWLVDLGPEGGERGGTIVASGTPEDVVKVSASHTGKALKPLLKTKKKTSRKTTRKLGKKTGTTRRKTTKKVKT